MTDEIDLYKRFGVPAPVPFSNRIDVVVADVQGDLRLIVAHQLEKLGFPTVQKFRDGRETIDYIKAKPCHVLLGGDDLPSVSGPDILKELKEDPQLVRGAFVLISRALNKNEVMLAVENGINELMIRPIVPADILPKIKSAYGNFTNPRNPERIYEHAKFRLREGKVDEAKAIYEALGAVNPTVARSHVGIGRVLMIGKKFDEACAEVSKAIAKNDKYVHAYSVRAEILLKLGKLDDAITDLRTAVDISPLNVARLQNCCEVLLANNLPNPCIEILSKSVAAGLEHAYVTERLGYCFFLEKQYDRALDYLRQAVKLDSENTSYMNSLAICLRDAQDYDGAISTYNQILKKEPENHLVLFNKALVLVRKDAKGDAVKILKRVVQMKPDYQKARDKLAEIEGDAGLKP
jgi:tetratricopeptide (TPR) repeat protein